MSADFMFALITQTALAFVSLVAGLVLVSALLMLMLIKVYERIKAMTL